METDEQIIFYKRLGVLYESLRHVRTDVKCLEDCADIPSFDTNKFHEFRLAVDSISEVILDELCDSKWEIK